MQSPSKWKPKIKKTRTRPCLKSSNQDSVQALFLVKTSYSFCSLNVCAGYSSSPPKNCINNLHCKRPFHRMSTTLYWSSPIFFLRYFPNYSHPYFRSYEPRPVYKVYSVLYHLCITNSIRAHSRHLASRRVMIGLTLVSQMPKVSFLFSIKLIRCKWT